MYSYSCNTHTCLTCGADITKVFALSVAGYDCQVDGGLLKEDPCSPVVDFFTRKPVDAAVCRMCGSTVPITAREV